MFREARLSEPIIQRELNCPPGIKCADDLAELLAVDILIAYHPRGVVENVKRVHPQIYRFAFREANGLADPEIDIRNPWSGKHVALEAAHAARGGIHERLPGE